jgi:carboxymethylenebutenolidase
MYQIRTDEIRLAGGGGEQQAWVSRPVDLGRYPAIVLMHGRNGVTDSYKDVGERFAEEGIVGLALNYFTVADNPSNAESQASAKAALEYLRAQAYVNPEQIVLSGYCKGGGLTYLGLGNVPGFAAGVIWHGGLTGSPENPADAALRANVPMLIIHGASDTPVPIQGVYGLATKLNDAGKHFELKVYWGTDHAFTLPGGDRYVPEHADDAFREAVLFIRRTFGLPVGTVGPLVRQPVGV